MYTLLRTGRLLEQNSGCRGDRTVSDIQAAFPICQQYVDTPDICAIVVCMYTCTYVCRLAYGGTENDNDEYDPDHDVQSGNSLRAGQASRAC